MAIVNLLILKYDDVNPWMKVIWAYMAINVVDGLASISYS
jgi:hypothetical protein